MIGDRTTWSMFQLMVWYQFSGIHARLVSASSKVGLAQIRYVALSA